MKTESLASAGTRRIAEDPDPRPFEHEIAEHELEPALCLGAALRLLRYEPAKIRLELRTPSRPVLPQDARGETELVSAIRIRFSEFEKLAEHRQVFFTGRGHSLPTPRSFQKIKNLFLPLFQSRFAPAGTKFSMPDLTRIET